jgi:anti-sigma factor RsiW
MALLSHAYVDGELDLMQSLEVEQHLRDCAACHDVVARLRALRAALADPALYHRPRAGLLERVRASLQVPGRPTRSRRPVPWLPLAAAASLVLAAVLGWGLWYARISAEDHRAEQVVAAHVRSLLIEKHLLDVESSDMHTVKPWFTGKIDFAPPVRDLAAEGFELAGGRLDYVDNHKAASLVYRRDKHVISLLIWPAAEGHVAPRSLTRQGFHAVHWADGDLTYWAISDLNEEELARFAQLLR